MFKFILGGIFFLAVATLYIGRHQKDQSLFDRAVNIFLIFMSCHAVYSLLIRTFFEFSDDTDVASPFVVAYAPFFYLGVKSLTHDKLNKNKLYLHFAPFAVFVIVFIVINATVMHEVYHISYYIIMYSWVVISMLGYAFWATMLNNTSGKRVKEKKQLFKTASYTLAVMSLLFVVVVFSRIIPHAELKVTVPRIILYGGMLMAAVLAFKFKVDNLLIKDVAIKKADQNEIGVEEINVSEHKPQPNLQQQKYNKSALSTIVLEEYKTRLDRLFDEENIYLDNELTLEVLAKKLKIPTHHVTQLFNVYIGENFNQYTNKFRINYSCRLLADEDENLSIEQVAFKSGFNSKVSFNRHFKNIVGSTPKEFVQNLRLNQ